MARVRARAPTQEVGDRQHPQRLLDAGRQHQLAEAKRADDGAGLACAARPRAWRQTRACAVLALQGERTKVLADQAGGMRAAGRRAPPRRCMQRKAVPLRREHTG